MTSSVCHVDDGVGDGFLDSVAGVLERHAAGLSEYELLQILRRAGYFAFLGEAAVAPHALFQAHFLLFHALYRLRDQAWQAGRAHLMISPLKIQWWPYRAGENAMSTPDALREYYLNLSNLDKTTAQDVDELIALFWMRLNRRDKRAAALTELGLNDPVDDETIRRTYRRLAMEHHPDRGGDKERLQAINAAIEVLLK